MKATGIFFGLAVACIVAIPSTAQGQERPWSVSFDLGMERGIAGDVHSGGTGTVLGLPTQVGARSYGDIYGNGFQWNAALGYAVNPTGELRFRFNWAKLEADRVEVGTVAGLPLFARFDDEQSFGMDAGYRQYLTSAERRVRPFLGGHVGFTRVDTIEAEFTVPAAGVTLAGTDFYAASTVPTFGISGGIAVALSDAVGIQGGIDLRWRGDLKAVDGLAGTGLDPINDESRRWSMPVSFGATIRF